MVSRACGTPVSLLTSRVVHSFADIRQQLFRLTGLPLSVVKSFACLAHVQLSKTRLCIFDRADGEVQALAGFAQLVELVIFG